MLFLAVLPQACIDTHIRTHTHKHTQACTRTCTHAHLQAIGALRKEHHTPISYIALDWHEMDKQLGHEGIVEAFWQTVG